MLGSIPRGATMNLKFYIISRTNPPNLELDDHFIAHLRLSHGLEIFPRVTNINLVKKECAPDKYTTTYFLYKIVVCLTKEQKNVLSKFPIHYFRLSHHNKESRLYEEKLCGDPSNHLAFIRASNLLTRLRLKNNFSGPTLSKEKAEKELKKLSKEEKKRAIKLKENRKKQYESLKQEFE